MTPPAWSSQSRRPSPQSEGIEPPSCLRSMLSPGARSSVKIGRRQAYSMGDLEDGVMTPPTRYVPLGDTVTLTALDLHDPC